MRKIKVGKKYHHFKGNDYEVIAIAYDSETNNDLEPRKLVVCCSYICPPANAGADNNTAIEPAISFFISFSFLLLINLNTDQYIKQHGTMT